MSIGALVTGLLGMGLIAVVLGVVGLRRTRANGTSGRGMAIAGIVLGATSLVAWAIFGMLFAFSVSPEDRRINELHEECAAGEMVSCDSLYHRAPEGSDEQEFGDTCGGRTDGGTYCTGTDPTSDADGDADAYGDDPALDALWDACAAGDGEACGDLAMQATLLSDYEDFGMTCGGTRESSYLSCP